MKCLLFLVVRHFPLIGNQAYNPIKYKVHMLICAVYEHTSMLYLYCFDTIKADFHLTGSDRIGTKEDISLLEIDVNVNFNQWNVFFCSNPVGYGEMEITWCYHFEHLIIMKSTSIPGLLPFRYEESVKKTRGAGDECIMKVNEIYFTRDIVVSRIFPKNRITFKTVL